MCSSNLFDASLVNHARAIRDEDVLAFQTERIEQAQARNRRGAGAGGDEPHLADVLADEAQRVDHGSRGDDGRAVLVVVKHGNADAILQLLFDEETLRRLDVLEIDASERRFETRDDVDQAIRIRFVDLDVEHVDARELLEQDGLALHDGFRRQRTDVAETEYRGSVRDHRNEVAARRVQRRGPRIGGDVLARNRDARRIGEREVVLIREGLRRAISIFPGRGVV